MSDDKNKKITENAVNNVKPVTQSQPNKSQEIFDNSKSGDAKPLSWKPIETKSKG